MWLFISAEETRDRVDSFREEYRCVLWLQTRPHRPLLEYSFMIDETHRDTMRYHALILRLHVGYAKYHPTTYKPYLRAVPEIAAFAKL